MSAGYVKGLFVIVSKEILMTSNLWSLALGQCPTNAACLCAAVLEIGGIKQAMSER